MCGGERTRFAGAVSIHPSRAGHPTATEDLGAATRTAIECRVRADWPLLRRLTTPSFRYHEAGLRLTGAGALVRAWRRLQAAFPDITVEIVDVRAAAGISVAGVVWRATQSTPIRTGAGLESPGHQRLEVWDLVTMSWRAGRLDAEEHRPGLLALTVPLVDAVLAGDRDPRVPRPPGATDGYSTGR